MRLRSVVQGLRVIRGGRRDRWQILGATVGEHHGKRVHGQLHQRSKKAPGETHGAIPGTVPGVSEKAKYATQTPLGPGLGATVGACHGVFLNQRMEKSLFLIDIVI